ncbi:hypothetical protein P7C71_g6512, partial [Lecanoromycetidae sp. Uapishka_2]
MPVPSLSILAGQACKKYHKAIMDLGEIGDAPYHLVRDILLRIEDPNKLRQIEIASPQICGLDEEIWLGFIKRDVPNWQTKPHIPKNPQIWYKVYRKLVKDNEREIERDAEILKATMDGIKKESDGHQLLQVNLAGVTKARSSRDVGTIHVKCDMRQPMPFNPNEVRAKKEDPNEDPDLPGRKIRERVFQGRQIKPPKGKLDKLRKEARAAALFPHPKLPGKSVWTAKELSSRAPPTKKTLLTAPRSMIYDYKRPAPPQPIDPTVKVPTIFAPRKRRIEHDNAPPAKKAKTSEIEEKERRLKAFTNPSSVTSSITTTLRPLPHKASTSATSASPTQLPQKDTSLPSETIMKALAATRTPSSRTSTDSLSFTVAGSSKTSRPGTLSPSNTGTPPPKRIIKSKAPVDIFMRPNKRPRVA